MRAYSQQKLLPNTPSENNLDPISDWDVRNKRWVRRGPWRPVTLRRPYLFFLVLATLALIGAVQWLLIISNRDGGIIFAKDINELPLRRSFYYLYLPTIVSVCYSFLWTWADLDIKRLEPYFQLSKLEGATGKGSILLNYPLEFLITVPFVAFKQRHWHVLCASMIMILIFWGVTPTQSGIFAVPTKTIVEEVSGFYSRSYHPIENQEPITGAYAQSVYNIAWLNETLPSFMTKEYMLSPFGPTTGYVVDSSNVNYTGVTDMYTADVTCEEPVLWHKAGSSYYNSSGGCSFYAPPIRTLGGNDTSKVFDTMYVGYQNENGMADYYLASTCDESYLHTFFIRWSRSSIEAMESGNLEVNASAPGVDSTSLLCKTSYYRQRANATITLYDNKVLEATAIGEKGPLPSDMFNATGFEWLMSAMSMLNTRSDYPATTFPDQKSRLLQLPLNLAYLPKTAPFAIATTQKPLEAYLDPETLRLSYESAYRLLFSRQMADVLTNDAAGGAWASVPGVRTHVTQAVVIVPGFAYAATALLVVVLVLGVGLATTIPRRENVLHKDPATLHTLMNMVAKDGQTLGAFASLDRNSEKVLHHNLADMEFTLARPISPEQGGQVQIRRRVARHGKVTLKSTAADCDVEAATPTKRGIRPTEMKLGMGIIFFMLQTAAVIVFLALFVKAKRESGLPLPSSSTFVRQLLENYIPIALATLIEPFWLILNRFLGLLQPYEQLRKGNALASRSIDVDYSSLPPQFLFFRAFKARHFVLMFLCFMVLLANVLTVAFGGLMQEGTALVSRPLDLSSAKATRFKALDGGGLPFNTDAASNWQGGTTYDQFYRLMSNLTANTALPPWTDNDYAYLPFDIDEGNVNATFRVSTIAYGTELQCRSFGPSKNGVRLVKGADAALLDMAVTLNDNGRNITCTNFKTSGITGQMPQANVGWNALEMATMLVSNTSSSENLFCRQHYLAGWLRTQFANRTDSDKDALSGSGPQLEAVDQKATILLCKPKILIGPADITIDSTGHVLERMSVNTTSSDLEPHFASNVTDLIAQSNQFLTNTGGVWHNDSYPSDFINYLIKQSTNDTTLLDSALPPPTAEHAIERLTVLYRRLFAIFIGSNLDLLLEDTSAPVIVTGTIILPETRILFSTAAFVVTGAILVCYIITTIFFYARRPWRVLPRLPSTVASNIAFFAASRAFRETDGEDEKREGGEERWAYGTFVGVDGKEHVGIEREPHVDVLTEVMLATDAR